MILYFDNYITDSPLIKNFYTELEKIRASCKSYSTRDKFEITIYTLASYAVYPWTKVIVAYSLEDESRKEEFERRVKELFPKNKLILIYGRSDTQKKYQEKLAIINRIKDNWVFYAGNNDHPFICPNFRVLNECLKEAQKQSRNNDFVSVLYSHLSESYNIPHKGTAIHDLKYPECKLINDKKDFSVARFNNGWNTAIQIVNKKLINHWLTSKDLGERIFKRIEEMEPFVATKDQIVICPKDVICEHFDGYSHTKYSGFSIPSNIVPPLFIPSGFFKDNIKIRYGYERYKEGWVNINPSKEKYVFEDKNGTDLKLTLDRIPLFWKKRIKKIDINPGADLENLKSHFDREFERYLLPFKSSKDKNYFWHILKYKAKRRVYDSKIMVPIFKFYKKSAFLKKIHRKINDLLFA